MRKLTILAVIIFSAGLYFGLQAAITFTTTPQGADWASRWFNYLAGFGVSFGVMALAGLMVLYPRRDKT